MRKSIKKTPAQQRAFMNNNCLRTLAALAAAFKYAGHPDYVKLVEELDGKFREKVRSK